MTVSAPAKINLTLDILRRREDGYHEMQMVMQTVSLADELTIDRDSTTGDGAPRVSTNRSYLPSDGNNLAAAAVRAFAQATGIPVGGCIIHIEKRIPVCAGLAGGSSDAAAVLHALNTLTGAGYSKAQLAEIGRGVGADVPYCVWGGTALAEGLGERITPLNTLPPCFVVLSKPDFPISTPELFAQIDCTRIRCRPDTAGFLTALGQGDLYGAARRMYNVFEDVLTDRRGAEIQERKHILIEHGSIGASMSGTGPSVFGLFDREDAAQAAFRALQGRSGETFFCRTI
ncbi:MAG: 4-(cytidine 5'-diphospho)-2-C-methyl-D-erythritol kinase [Oscillospiraceae bacterium]|nr:4-(cytidine 5'-diphospho)-2-C-methyl-D-erythritol kinase [Oscillospiraceae bacterium]